MSSDTPKTLLVGERRHAARLFESDAFPETDLAHAMARDRRAFSNGSCRARLDWLGLSPFRAVNLLPPSEIPGEWETARARRNARAFAAQLADDGVVERVVLLGRRVATAFEVGRPFLWAGSVADKPCLLLPHPSGRSRWWNDPSNSDAARGAVAAFMEATRCRA